MPPTEATAAYLPSCSTRMSGFLRSLPDFAPRLVTMMTARPVSANVPASAPPERSYASTWSRTQSQLLGSYSPFSGMYSSMTNPDGLTVAVTGPTGEIGISAVEALERDSGDRQDHRLGAPAVRSASRGWTKTEYRQGDILDRAAIDALVADADVVVHLAYLIMGSREESRRINLAGTRNVFEATVAGPPTRLVYTSSVAAYGYHSDNPVPLTEDVPTRGSKEHYYSEQKAECEALLREVTDGTGLEVYVLRPCIVAGPKATALADNMPWRKLSDLLPAPLNAAANAIQGMLPLMPDPGIPLQLVHHDDVAAAVALATVGAGKPGAYNLAGDGEISLAEVAEATGTRSVRVPRAVATTASTVLAKLPLVPAMAEWIHVSRSSVVMDAGRAKTELGWRPVYTARQTLERDLRGALDSGALDLAFQPIVRVVDRHVTGVEALLRWASSERGPVSPLAMVAAAEQSGLITEIGAWVLERACQEHGGWLRANLGAQLDLSVNISARQLMSPGFSEDVAAVLRRTDMDPTALVLEITESVLVSDPAHAILVLGELKRHGVRIALDDFGTGYSSLSYLRQLPIDIVKIDQSFIADLHQARDGGAIVAGVTSLAHALGLLVIAEGVETIGQHERIASLGCDSAQGFFYARPMASPDIAAALSAAASRPWQLPSSSTEAQHPLRQLDIGA